MIRLILPMIALLALTACETMKGAGRDLQGAGAAITTEAKKAEPSGY